MGPTVRQQQEEEGRAIGRAGSSEARDLISYQRIPLFCPLPLVPFFIAFRIQQAGKPENNQYLGVNY